MASQVDRPHDVRLRLGFWPVSRDVIFTQRSNPNSVDSPPARFQPWTLRTCAQGKVVFVSGGRLFYAGLGFSLTYCCIYLLLPTRLFSSRYLCPPVSSHPPFFSLKTTSSLPRPPPLSEGTPFLSLVAQKSVNSEMDHNHLFALATPFKPLSAPSFPL